MIFNFTQHTATPDQVNAGVVDLTGEELNRLKSLLTFNKMPTRNEIEDVAENLAKLADEVVEKLGYPKGIMIGGAPYLMPYLTHYLNGYGFDVYFAFSERVSKEVHNADGSVSKVNEFKHSGFVVL